MIYLKEMDQSEAVRLLGISRRIIGTEMCTCTKMSN